MEKSGVPHGIWHILVPTDDLPRAKDFYEKVMGLTVLSAEKRKIRPNQTRFNYEWYDMGDVEFHVGERHPSLIQDTGGRVNPTMEVHIAFEVDDIEAAKRNLEAKGIEYVDMSKVTGNMQLAKQIFLRDPDNNLVELAERAK
jgi:catechol 2,3-dioxygenase-like lactoylglutathione lyase family enzyme